MRYTHIPDSAFLKDVFDTMFGYAFRNKGGEQSCISCHTDWTQHQCRCFAYMLAAAGINVEDLNSPEVVGELGFDPNSGGILFQKTEEGVEPYCRPCIDYKTMLTVLQRLWHKKHPDKP